MQKYINLKFTSQKVLNFYNMKLFKIYCIAAICKSNYYRVVFYAD